jgi:hypothetical protein
MRQALRLSFQLCTVNVRTRMPGFIWPSLLSQVLVYQLLINIPNINPFQTF